MYMIWFSWHRCQHPHKQMHKRPNVKLEKELTTFLYFVAGLMIVILCLHWDRFERGGSMYVNITLHNALFEKE